MEYKLDAHKVIKKLMTDNNDVRKQYTQTDIGWQRSAVVSALAAINVANRHWAWLLLGRVTARGQVNRLGI